MTRFFGVEKFKGLLLAGSFAAATEFLMGFLGSVVSGHLLGEEALAGVSLAAPVLESMKFFSALIGAGMGINYSLRMGRCDRRGAHEIFTQSIWTVLAVGGAVAMAMVVGREAFLGYMNPTAAVAAHARAYWTWFVPVAVLEPLAFVLLNVCYADGDSRLCYVAYGVQLAVNLAVSVALLKAGHGTAGCAIGVVAGYAAACVALTGHFLRRTNTFALVRHFSAADSWRIFRSSFGDACGFIGDAVVFFFLGKIVILHYGSGMLPVMSAVLATLGLVGIAAGVATAAQPVVTVYFGERNYKAVRIVMRHVIGFVVAEGAVITAVLAFFPQFAVLMVGIEDPLLAAHCCAAVRIVSIGYVFAMFANVMNNYYQYVGREDISTGLSLWKWVAMPLVALAVFGGVGPDAMWVWYPFYNIVAVAFFFIYLRAIGCRETFFLQLPRNRDRWISVFNLELNEDEIVSVSQLVAARLEMEGVAASRRMRAQLMTEEVLMAVKDRNAGRRVLAEVTLDLNDGVRLTLRDDGVIFDITDSNAHVSSLRSFLVASVMERQAGRLNLTTTGFNRNVFRL